MAAKKTSGPLQGIRVLDVTHMLSGPYCTWLLGALGADVIKIERPKTGDQTRRLDPRIDDESIYFLSVNRNKRSLTLDLKHQRGRDIFLKLAQRSDVLVENNRAGVMDRLGLGAKDLAAINPGLVYASLSGFGQDGPYRDKPSYDVVAQALSGMMSITGDVDGEPCRAGASIGDIGASLFTTIGVLSALQQRGRTGKGSFIDVAMLDCQLALMENAVARVLNAGETPRPLGSRHPLIAPFQAFPTADRPIAICIDSEDRWHKLCQIVGVPQLAEDPRLDSGPKRNRLHAEIEPVLKKALLGKSRDEWLFLFDEADIPASPVNSVPEAVADPQVLHRQMVVAVPAGSNRKFSGVPIHIDGHPVCEESAAPKLGEHNAAVLGDLGFGAAEIAELERDGVI